MKLNVNRTAGKPEMEKKQEKKVEEKSTELIAAEQKALLLQEQLSRLSADQESLALEKETEKMAKETAALEAEADLKRTLGEEFSEEKRNLKAGEELSNEQLIAIMGEAVGASSEAQGKLILKKVEALVGVSNAEIKKTQQLLIELAAGVSMNQIRSEHPDYDDFKTEIAGIMSTTRGLSPADAYVLAKAKKTQKQPNQQQFETERPGGPPESTASLRDDYVQEKDPEVQQSPKAIFIAAASKAVDKHIAGRFSNVNV